MSPSGCHVLDRDASACADARKAQGISGFWLEFSCRVTLSTTSGVVKAEADGQPDYESNYFPASNACHEDYTGAIQNPNTILGKSYVVQFPLSQDTNATTMMGVAVVGMAVNGVPIFGDFAAPGDDIYKEAKTFNRCGGHPQMTGIYHYHSEPYALTYDDNRFVGVMRDGYPIYGRKDPDGTYPTVDAYGGHTGVTLDSPDTPVYHYHVNEQTSTNPGTAGQKQWFLTKGSFRGTPAPCGSCN
ncbi:MAG: YHYH protein [Minicystis sp.]